jgi:hypothetical protein
LIYMYDVNYEVEIALCNVNKDTLQLKFLSSLSWRSRD